MKSPARFASRARLRLETGEFALRGTEENNLLTPPRWAARTRPDPIQKDKQTCTFCPARMALAAVTDDVTRGRCVESHRSNVQSTPAATTEQKRHSREH